MPSASVAVPPPLYLHFEVSPHLPVLLYPLPCLYSLVARPLRSTPGPPGVPPQPLTSLHSPGHRTLLLLPSLRTGSSSLSTITRTLAPLPLPPPLVGCPFSFRLRLTADPATCPSSPSHLPFRCNLPLHRIPALFWPVSHFVHFFHAAASLFPWGRSAFLSPLSHPSRFSEVAPLSLLFRLFRFPRWRRTSLSPFCLASALAFASPFVSFSPPPAAGGRWRLPSDLGTVVVRSR